MSKKTKKKSKKEIKKKRSIADLAESCYYATSDEWAADVAIRGGREEMEKFLAKQYAEYESK